MSVNSVGNSQVNAARGGGSDYTVRRGDTLSEIARDHGVSLRDLIAANPQIANPDLIFPDQRINLPAGGRVGGGAGGTGGIASAAGQPVSGPSANAAAVAEQYLGRNAADLRSDRSDNLPMQPGIPTNVNCANFVSAVLVEAGQLRPNQQTASVSVLRDTLRANGWTQVSAAEARPGDVIIQKGTRSNGRAASHVVMVSGPNETIGSNNVNPDRSQRVTHGTLSGAMRASSDVTIWRAPPGVGGAADAGPTTAATGAAPSGSGSVSAKTDQAIRYFESQGWTHAQAAGIVANLLKESDLRPDAIGDGGKAYGLAQWHPDRQANFARFAGHSIRTSTFAEQLAFVNHELRTTESAAGNRLRGANTAAEAGSIVSRFYERPADVTGAASARAQLATQIAAR